MVSFCLRDALRAPCLVIGQALCARSLVNPKYFCRGSLRTVNIFAKICIIKRDALLDSLGRLFRIALRCFEMKGDEARIRRPQSYRSISVSHILNRGSIKIITFRFLDAKRTGRIRYRFRFRGYFAVFLERNSDKKYSLRIIHQLK